MENILNIPTEPKYDFMFIIETESDFNTIERKIYNSLVYYDNMNGEKWCSPMTDSGQTMYACEVPSPDRISKIQEVVPILSFLGQIQAEPQRIEEFKTQMQEQDIPEDWKWIISKLQIVDRNIFSNYL